MAEESPARIEELLLKVANYSRQLKKTFIAQNLSNLPHLIDTWPFDSMIQNKGFQTKILHSQLALQAPSFKWFRNEPFVLYVFPHISHVCVIPICSDSMCILSCSLYLLSFLHCIHIQPEFDSIIIEKMVWSESWLHKLLL